MINNSRGFTPILIVIILLIGFVGGLFFATQFKNTPPEVKQVLASPTPSLTPTPQNLGWQIYTNKKYGFSVELPPGYSHLFTEDVNKDDKTGYGIKGLDTELWLSPGGEALVSGDYTGDRIDMNIYPEALNSPLPQSSPTNTVEWAGQRVSRADGLAGHLIEIGPLVHNGIVYEIHYAPAKVGDTATFDKILATFKFNN